MGLIHFILDLAALLLWLSWRAKPDDALAAATPTTLAGTLRRVETRPLKRWPYLVALIALLLARPAVYCGLGPAVSWTAQVNLIATRVAFKNDFRFFDRLILADGMLLFSILSFLVALAVFYLWLLLLSMLSRGWNEQLALTRLVREQLGLVERWPTAIKLLLPFVVASVGWWTLTWPLAAWDLMPRPSQEGTRLAQAALVGLGSYLAWKPLVLALLALHLLHNHIYFGAHPIWNFVDHAAKRLLAPLRVLRLRVARVDLTPLTGIALVLLLTNFVEFGFRPPTKFDEQGRPLPPAFEIPGLVDLYPRVSR